MKYLFLILALIGLTGCFSPRVNSDHWAECTTMCQTKNGLKESFSEYSILGCKCEDGYIIKVSKEPEIEEIEEEIEEE